jgi:aspartate racemase
MQNKKLGVIGGLGPLATAYFYELVTEFTEIEVEQEHLEIMLYSAPAIPDRTSYILDNSKPSPIPGIIRVGKSLVDAGCEVIAIPCVTAHHFFDEFSAEIDADIISMTRETAAELKKHGIKSAGIMATDGTVQTGILERELVKEGITPVLPSKEGQQGVMDLIYYCVKSGNPLDLEKFRRISDELREKGAEVIILGCTELSLFRREDIGGGYIDVLEVLASRSIERCGGRVRAKYRNLLQ